MRVGIFKYRKQTSGIAIFLIFAFSFIANKALSQDVHFSQFYSAVNFINPSATGAFDGLARAGINYRNQWTTLGSNYQTYSAFYEMTLMKKKAGGNFMGLGVNILSDKAGIGALTRSLFNLSGAYHLQVNDENNIALGLQGGYGQRAIDQSQLTWNNQYDGSQYNAALPSNETFTDKVNYIDVAAGLLWTYTISNTADINAGIGAFHLSQPSQALISSSEDKLPMKIIAHGQGRFTKRNSDLAYYPNFMLALQGPNKEINGGLLIRYMLKESSRYTGFIKGNAVYFGANYRLGDAAIILLGAEISDFKLGISYDVNISGFSKATAGVGGFELSLIYIKSD